MSPSPREAAGAEVRPSATIPVGRMRAAHELLGLLRDPLSLSTVAVWGVVSLLVVLLDPTTAVAGTDVPVAAVFLAGLPAAAALTAGIVVLPQSVAGERGDGTLLRVRAWPGGTAAYALGRALAFATVAFGAVALALLPALVAGRLQLPDGVGPAAVLVVALVLGVVAMAAIGLIIGSLLPAGGAGGTAGPGGTALSLALGVLLVVSGLALPPSVLPDALRAVGDVLPTRWMGHGVRYALVPGGEAAEPGGWHPGVAIAVLAVWAIVGAAVAPVVLRRRTRRPAGTALTAAERERREVAPAPARTPLRLATAHDSPTTTRRAHVRTPTQPAPQGDDTVIAVSDLWMAYGERTVLRGLDLEVGRGEVFALLGPNGAGKTTAVEILEGYRLRSAGEATVLGRDPADPDDGWRDRIGVVLQRAHDHESWTPKALLRYAAAHFRDPWPVDDLLGRVELQDQASQAIGKLSGGQRRRLDVALGLVGRPELLFLDEPTTGFDPEVRRRFWDLVSEVAAGGTTVLLTTHYLDEAEHLADRIGILTGGRIATLGTPTELGELAGRARHVRWREHGEVRTQETEDPGRLVADLVERLGSVDDLEVRRPSLEEVYLRLVADEADGVGAPDTGAGERSAA